MSMRPLNIIFLITLLIFTAILYAIFISFSEHREYSSASVDYFLLTPAELSELSKKCIDSPIFVYSSADGPKPVIVTLNCTMPVAALEDQMRFFGFSYLDGLYQKEGTQIQVTKDLGDATVVSVAYIGNN